MDNAVPLRIVEGSDTPKLDHRGRRILRQPSPPPSPLAPHERVYDWPGGQLQIVRVVYGPVDRSGHTELEWVEKVGEPVESLPLGHGLAIPAGLTLTLRSEGEPIADVEIGVVAGRPACIAIRARDGHELTTKLLRQIRGLGRGIREVVARNALRVMRTTDGEVIGEHYLDTEEIVGLNVGIKELRAETDRLTTPRRRTPLTDDFLREVADVYRTARAQGTSTQGAIQKRWPTSEANARRWVARARKAGFLGPAPADRQGGEQSKGDRNG
jgi:hypothetical protein